MASPSMVQRSGDKLIVRSVVSGDRLFMDFGQGQAAPAEQGCGVGVPPPPYSLPIASLSTPHPALFQEEDALSNVPIDELPQCKIKRNYNCVHCNYFTQNPRYFLTHLRDVHDEKVKIYDCPTCLYASRHFQKLLRHMKMVHGSAKGVEVPLSNKRKVKTPSPEITEPQFTEEMEVEEHAEKLELVEQKSNRGNLKCSMCPFTTNVASLLTKHERKEHVKTKFFPCSKCNYVTHIKARFTKHVKYHSMPMIKCEVCDFRTPYKWNLDRHMKNHGGTGAFCCSVCNFTADIKQSLTVHEMNHHVPPAGQPASGGPATLRRRNKVGGSDNLLLQTQPTAPRTSDNDHSTGDSNQSEFMDMAMLTDNSNDRHSSSSKTEVLENSLNYIDTNNDSLQNEFINYDMFPREEISGKLHKEEISAGIHKVELNFKTQTKKIPRPIPKLIPLNLPPSNLPPKSSQPVSALNLSTIQKSFSENTSHLSSSAILSENYDNEDSNDQIHGDNLSTRGSDESSQQSIQVSTQTIFKKKNASFFDKLKEKLLTTSAESGDLSCKECGHLSKCLSEHSAHEKICSNAETKSSPNNFSLTGSGSTRCQYCRHRCKSSIDLVVHMQSCPSAGKDRESPEGRYKTDKIELPIKPESDDEASVDDPQGRHPMENVVFVWNSMLHQSNSLTFENTHSENASDMSEDFIKKNSTSTPNNQENSGTGKKVFRCPHCPFWASTASRFHVHIVGHLNKKPFECSLCSYRSNWRWDITKHIRLKSVRDPDHSTAGVLMTDETGRRNYSKYNKYLTLLKTNVSDFSDSISKKTHHELEKNNFDKPDNNDENRFDESLTPEMPFQFQDPLNTQDDEFPAAKKPKRTLWKCKKCSYRNTSKDALLLHVRNHSKTNNLSDEESKGLDMSTKISQDPMENTTANIVDLPGSLTYRCGHCYQVSNWKHVIQRHCRLKHNGDVRVIVGEKGQPDKMSMPNSSANSPAFNGRCPKCPYINTDRKLYDVHFKKHNPSTDAIFRCLKCSYFVSTEQDLIQHLPLHGINDPDHYIATVLNSKTSNSEGGPTLKRYKCYDCPYESNSKSQFMYHEQFHKASDAPFKCEICSYQVSKRHLLHQHMKVHNVPANKDISEISFSDYEHLNTKEESSLNPPVWIKLGDQFHKMFNCQFCPFLHQDKLIVTDHEQLHNKDINGILKCQTCTFTCNNLEILMAHSKVHLNTYPKVICQVNSRSTDEEQLIQLRQIIQQNDKEQADHNEMYIEEDLDLAMDRSSNNKLLFFCQRCPARFLFEKELQIHTKFHYIKLPFQCQICSYTARQESHLLAHKCVHSEEYQTKTKGLQQMHSTHPQHIQPNVVGVASGVNVLVPEPVWIVVAESKKPEIIEDNDEPMETAPTDEPLGSKSTSKNFKCHLCPAKFFKNAALHYHISLHGGKGTYKCKQCNYAVKTLGNLAKHETIHENPQELSLENDNEYEDDMNLKCIPLSGTDLFQHKTQAEKRALSGRLITRPNDHFPPVLQADPQFGLLIHGNPDFIYPTYLKNGRQKEKRYKCHKCPSAFEKREQYKVHLSLHGSKQRYKCELCDYSVKYYANYVQHMRKHQMNADAHAKRQNNFPHKEKVVREGSSVQKPLQLAMKTLPQQPTNKDSSRISVSDQQRLVLLQRRRSSAASSKELQGPEEKKHYRCMHCPYVNFRRDALDNHLKRHTPQSGSHKCPHCNYATPQSQFLRDHLKTHFNTQKHLTPEYFTNFDGLEIYLTKLDETDNSSNQEICIFRAKDVTHIQTDESQNIERPKMFVVPGTGERVEVSVE